MLHKSSGILWLRGPTRTFGGKGLLKGPGAAVLEILGGASPADTLLVLKVVDHIGLTDLTTSCKLLEHYLFDPDTSRSPSIEDSRRKVGSNATDTYSLMHPGI